MSKQGMMAAVAAAAGLTTEPTDAIELTAASLKQYFPAIASELAAEGAAAERARIQGIEAAALPGHDAIIQAHKADASKTPADAMLAVITAEKSLRASQLTNLDKDEQQVKGLRAEPANGAPEPKDPLAGLTGDALLAAEYSRSAELQAEFGSEKSYLAFKKAESDGRAKILNRKAG